MKSSKHNAFIPIVVSNPAGPPDREFGVHSDDEPSTSPKSCNPPKFSPEWALVKRCEGTAEPIPLDDTDLYVGRCPECGEPVSLSTENFFTIIGGREFDGIDVGIWCDSCHAKSKEADTNPNPQTHLIQILDGISVQLDCILHVGVNDEDVTSLKRRIDDKITELTSGASDGESF